MMSEQRKYGGHTAAELAAMEPAATPGMTLVAAARNALPDLLARIAELEGLVSTLTQIHGRMLEEADALRLENESYRAAIPWHLQYEAELKADRDQARAQAARLREALSNPAVIFETEYAESFALEVLAETPAASLEAIRAEAKREERAALAEEIERIEMPPNLEGPAVGAWISARNYAAHIVRTFGLKGTKGSADEAARVLEAPPDYRHDGSGGVR